MNRPELSRSLLPIEFSRWYWLKTELAEFCRANLISAAGSKQELTRRIDSLLKGQLPPATVASKKRYGAMPKQCELSSVIGTGWRCSQELRAFFESQVGESFHFNQAVRDFISNRAGSSLEQAIEHYRKSLKEPRKPISEQFEYNRHIRDYHDSNPGASRAEAIAAWWAKRARPGD